MTPEESAWQRESRGPVILGATWGLVGLATLFVAARLYVRGRLLRRFFLDDYIVVISMILGWIAAVLETISIHHGNGRHLMALTPRQRVLSTIFALAAYVPGILYFVVPKLAVVALLTRVLRHSIPFSHRLSLWLITIVCLVLNTLAAIFIFTRCSPAAFQWNPPAHPGGTCWPSEVYLIISVVASALSAFCDLCLAAYPTFVLARLRISRRKKIWLSLALGIGFVSFVVAVYKTTLLPRVDSPDPTYDTAPLLIWTVAEGTTVTIATTIPVLQPVLVKIFGKNCLDSTSKRRNPQESISEEHHKRFPSPMGRGPRNNEVYAGEPYFVTLVAAPQAARLSGGGRPSEHRTSPSACSEADTHRSLLPSLHSGRRPRATHAEHRDGPSDGILRTDRVSVSVRPRVGSSPASSRNWSEERPCHQDDSPLAASCRTV